MRPYGLNFRGGISPGSTPVILVSDGTVAIRAEQSYGVPHAIPWLTVFAGDVRIQGPKGDTTPVGMTLSHVTGLDPQIIDPLIDAGLLPNMAPGQNRRLQPVAGTFSQSFSP
jgi:hypothetical protein